MSFLSTAMVFGTPTRRSRSPSWRSRRSTRRMRKRRRCWRDVEHGRGRFGAWGWTRPPDQVRPSPTSPRTAIFDLGIYGRKAIVCGSSRGLGRACAEALARAGTVVVVKRHQCRSRRARRRGDHRRDRWAHHRRRGGRDDARGAGSALRGGAVAGHPRHQRRRAAGQGQGLPGAGPRGDLRRRRDEHGHPDRADPARRGRHGGAALRADRQHHLDLGEDADPGPRPLLRRAGGADQLPRRRAAHRRACQCDGEQPAARLHRHRPVPRRA